MRAKHSAPPSSPPQPLTPTATSCPSWKGAAAGPRRPEVPAAPGGEAGAVPPPGFSQTARQKGPKGTQKEHETEEGRPVSRTREESSPHSDSRLRRADPHPPGESTSETHPDTALSLSHEIQFQRNRAVSLTSGKVEQPKCPCTGKWINKTWSMHTAGHHSALESKEIPTHRTTGMNPEDTMPSKISQSQKDQCCRIPLLGGP